jgi:hypothetical protein
MPTQEPSAAYPFGIIEVRYLRKAVRYRLRKRETPPSGKNTARIHPDRRRELDAVADWFVQEKA